MIDTIPETEFPQTQIKEIDLSVDKITEPLNAYRVDEGKYGIASFSPQRPFLITYGLSACQGLIIYDRNTQKGLLSHLSTVKDIEKIIDKFISAFGENSAQTDAFLMSGSKTTRNPINWLPSEPRIWPTSKQIIEGLIKRGIKTISLDTNQGRQTHPRGIALNLENGKINEIDNSHGWTWSNLQDTSINQWNE